MNEKLITLIKLTCITYLIIFLPRIISKQGNNGTQSQENIKSTEKSSLYNLLNNNNYNWINQLRLAIISDKKATDQAIAKNLDLVLKKNFKIQAIILAKSRTTNKINKDVILNKSNSIKTYQWNYKINKFPQEIMNSVDAIVFDMQNNGLKNSKTFNTLLSAMKIASTNNKKLIILDKPNPLGGYIEGPGAIPLRYGLTIGEMAIYLNKFDPSCKALLTVIPITYWERNFIKNTQKPFNNSVILEKKLLKILNQIKPVNEGCKSKQKAQAILLPKNQTLSTWEHEYFKKLCLKTGISCKDHSISLKNNQLKGVKIKLKKEIKDFSIYNSFLTISRFLNNRKNINLSFSGKFNELTDLYYTKEFLNGSISFEELKKETEKSLVKFYTKVKSCLLYYPYPKIIAVKLIRI